MRDESKDLRDRTKAFAIKVIRKYSTFAKSTEAQILGKQVLRSGISVGGDYREACRARSKAEFVAKLGDCLKELDETSYWFDLLVETKTVASASLEPLQKGSLSVSEAYQCQVSTYDIVTVET